MFNNPKIEHYVILYLNKELFMYLFKYYIIYAASKLRHYFRVVIIFIFYY